MSCEKILEGLDLKQQAAVQSESNAVVSAGAGSGKTRVIASRYAWLVMEKGLPVEEIITLTFTNKAVNEMYSRIYGLLAAQKDDPRAREAVANFNRANILTLDSFCTGVARLAARRYGINPDFVCDPEGVRALALETALPFVLNKRDNRGLQALMGDKKIQALAEDLFAEAVLSAASIAAPLDFEALWEKQREEICRAWNKLAGDAAMPVKGMVSAMGDLKKPGEQIEALLKQDLSFPPVPDIQALLAEESSGAARKQFRDFFLFLEQFRAISFSGRLSPEKEIISEHRDALRELAARLESIALFALSAGTIREVFSLLEEYQREFNQKKREAGLLTFADIAHLAVDALSRYPDLRQFYNRSFSAIMIDEFQDNNKLQRDLIFLLAENADCGEPGIPGFSRLNPNKMIFVGDEKQSIYRFRGADVSVFRALAGSFSQHYAGGHISLDFNYRSNPLLIRAFNYFFGGLLPGGGAGPEEPVFLRDEKNLPDYEARYEKISSGLRPGEPDAEDKNEVPLHFCFLDEGQIPPDDPYKLSTGDLEAAFIAQKIRDMVDGACEIQTREGGRTGKRGCHYGDFAVLLRTTVHQISLEKQFQNFGIPYHTDDPAGLFSDAPINDLFNFLRLLVYPHDKASYAALIRSPFCGFSDLVLSLCMLDTSGIPFNEALEEKIPAEERETFRKAREQYHSLVEEARTRPAAELLTLLWYEAGYRYETLWSPSSQIYGELFDYFFELARQSDRRGRTLAEFLDNFDQIIKNDERIKELRVPVEREGGVRIMTIHKSKGLEFPVVFIPGCRGKTRIDYNGKPFFYGERWGFSLNLPGVEELPGGGKNYFYLLQQDEEKQKAIAELRRLLYVAMTRAESRLFMCAVLPSSGDKDDREDAEHNERGTSWIPERLKDIKAKKENSDALPGFLDLLIPVLTAEDHSFYTLETIPAYSRAELSRFYIAGRRTERPPVMADAAEAAAAFYENAPPVSPPRPALPGVSASALRYVPPAASPVPAEEAPDDIDVLLRQAKLAPAEFGTIVHAYLEAFAQKRNPRLPSRFLARLSEKAAAAIDGAAKDMAEKFLASDLGRRSLADPARKSEYPVLTMVEAEDGKIPVYGVIDLLFESDGLVQILDFKTDKTVEPERHLAQLAVYRRAVSDIFGKPVRAWLYYLRSGKAVDLSADLEQVNIEKTIAAYLGENPV
ncbi:MAG: UvrD-helicase domain-containing protein [Treponema sp.]|nr:UvrD-helicase domain-containing protein [Treponema sp.]